LADKAIDYNCHFQSVLILTFSNLIQPSFRTPPKLFAQDEEGRSQSSRDKMFTPEKSSILRLRFRPFSLSTICSYRCRCQLARSFDN